jgi:lipoprotein-releasing system permease protein
MGAWPMPLFIAIALKHLLARKRQSIVSVLGVILGVGFFLAVSSLMQGSQADFIHRLVDNSPHITISDEYRNPRHQPAQTIYANGAVEIHSIKPLTENRGIRGYRQILEYLRTLSGVEASPVLEGQVIVSYAGQDIGMSLSGMIPSEIHTVSTIQKYMTAGSIDALIANPGGIIMGNGLARRLSLTMGDNITVTASNGQVRTFKLVGLFTTGRGRYDDSQAFVDLKRVQALMNRPSRVNSIIIRVADSEKAQEIASEIESRIGYKAMSWQEASKDMMDTLNIRNIIMYSVVSAVLIVAAFGIYNVISTVVLEKHKDIAILKSMGFRAADIRRIFVTQGFLLGIVGNLVGIPLGCAIMYGLMQIKMRFPGSGSPVQMPISWDWRQFALAIAFAMIASIVAAWLPARKGAKVHPVEILRGGA